MSASRRAAIVAAGIVALGALPRAWAQAASAPQPGAADSPISAVEQRLFLDSHLKALKLPATLRYAVDVQGELKKAEHFDVELALARAKDGIDVRLSTPRAEAPVAIPVEGDVLNNPIVMYFLDRDIETMEKLTGGKKGYFNRRLRMAFAAASRIENAQITIAGRSEAVQQVSLQPFLDDPLRPRFEKFAGKRYTFAFSKATPGEVLQLQTVIPGANGNFDKPLLTETLVFEGRR